MSLSKIDDKERYILNAIRDIQYGSVEVVIHNSHIVQVEKKQKQRFDSQNHTA